jgi:hypothetical protein
VHRALIILLLVMGVSETSRGFATLGSKWKSGTVTMLLQLTQSRALLDRAASFDSVAADALSIWNRHLELVQFEAVLQSTRPKSDGDLINNVFFDNTYYGERFDENTLAVTTRWTLNGSERVEGDVVFNTSVQWNSYRGPLRAENGRTVWDLRRVSLHEFGHVLGLDHPDEHGQQVDALMNSILGDSDSLTEDDIAGAASLYKADPARPVNAVPPQEVDDFVRRLEAFYSMMSLLDSRITPNPPERWLTEYFRYRLNGCGHRDASTKVFQQILGQGIQPTC